MTTHIAALSSALILSIGVLFAHRFSFKRMSALLFFILALASLIFIFAYIAASYFSDEGINAAVIYHLQYGLEGTGYYEYRYLIGGVVLGLAATLVYLTIKTRKLLSATSSNAHKPHAIPVNLAIMASILVNPVTSGIYDAALEYSTAKIPDNAEIAKSLTYYVQPEIKPIGNHPKNLVYIYAESLERTYLDERLFPGLAPNLKQLEKKAISFSQLKQTTAASWTVAGMTASQCGIPLYTPSHGNSMSGMDKFLPSAICLGDLLKKQGYNLSYIGGSKLSFAGKGKLYKSHGFDDVRGLTELKKNLDDPEYTSAWGLFDDSLFDMIFSQYEKLSQQDAPFGLFTLTLDTHHPNGHPSKSCDGVLYGDGSNPILNAVNCSDKLISELVAKIQASPNGKNTVIVVASDHLAMRNTAYDKLTENPNNRNNLLMIIPPDLNGGQLVSSFGSTLDVGTTLLPFIGFTGTIGFGRDLMDESPERITETHLIFNKIDSWKQTLTLFWGFPQVAYGIEIKPKSNTMMFDNRSLGIPALVELDENLSTIVKFDFDRSVGHKTLRDHVNNLDTGTAYVLVDLCKNSKTSNSAVPPEKYCLELGTKGKSNENIGLPGNYIVSRDDLVKLVSSATPMAKRPETE